MPGWHAATQALQAQGKARMVGLIPEQHPDRCRLFMQWKRMDWPILVDPFNLLQLSAVPITLLLDEHGIIRYIRPRLEDLPALEREFFDQTFEPPPQSSAPPTAAPDLAQLQRTASQGTAAGWRAYGLALALWAAPHRLDEAIEALHQAVDREPEYAPAHFYLGVTYRLRYDSTLRRPEDFQQAVNAWSQALDLNPNNYIWRRRIQQYGPRLDKPYAFYDWVNLARQEIRARGETPLSLAVEPGGAEFAYPAQQFTPGETLPKEPDPAGRITRDEGQWVQAETTVIPSTQIDGVTALRVNLTLRPNPAVKAHWNNEVDDTRLWVNPPPGWQIDPPYLAVPNPPEPVSQETRTFEFEVKPPEQASGGITLPAYTLYYVCEDIHGTCLYRRQDLSLRLEL